MNEYVKEIFMKIQEKKKEKKVPTAILVSRDVMEEVIITEQFKMENNLREITYNLFGLEIMMVSSITREVTRFVKVV